MRHSSACLMQRGIGRCHPQSMRHHSLHSSVSQPGQVLPPRDIYSFSACGGSDEECPTGIHWTEVREAAKHPTIPRKDATTENDLTQMSIVLGLRHPDLYLQKNYSSVLLPWTPIWLSSLLPGRQDPWVTCCQVLSSRPRSDIFLGITNHLSPLFFLDQTICKASLCLNRRKGTSLVAQWLRIRLPMQGTRIRSLLREDPTCHGATKPMRHNYWACALEPSRRNHWAHVLQLLKPAGLELVLRNKE